MFKSVESIRVPLWQPALMLAGLLVYLSIRCAAQELPFKHFTVEAGLSHNSVTDIRQDAFGFLWIATANGLNRFNGYDFEVFEADTGGLPSNNITALAVDGSDLWIGTRKGLCYWSQQAGLIRNTRSFFNDDALWNQYNIGDISVDSRGGVWVLAESGGFHVLHKARGAAYFEKKLFLPDQPAIIDGFYGQIIEDDTGRILVGTSRAGLWQLEPDGTAFAKVDLEPRRHYAISCLLQDVDGNLWMGTLSGLYRRERNSAKFQEVKGLSDSTVRCLYQDVAGHVLVGTDVGGLNLYNKERNTFIIYDHKLEDRTTLLHNSVKAIFQDRQNILWVGTYAGGLSAHDPNMAAFIHFHSGISNRDLNNNAVTGFAEDEKGNYWVATDRGGLNYYHPDRKIFNYYRHDGRPGSLSSDIVQDIFISSTGTLWVGNWATGLDFNDGHGFKNIGAQPNRKNALLSNSVNHIQEDRDHNLWLATGNGLNFVRRENIAVLKKGEAVFEAFQNNVEDSTSLSDNFVRYVLQDRAGDIWVCTWVGLNRFDPATKSFQHFRNNPDGLKIYTDDLVACMAETDQGNFLIGTNERGLLYYKRDEDKLIVFNKANGFPSSTVAGIVKDDKGYWWISTTNGLVRFDEHALNFNVYTQSDGLPSNEFRSNACYKTSTGHLMFGGNNGFVMFHPSAIRHNSTPPKIVLTEFRVFNEVIKPSADGMLKTDISLTKQIDLSYDQSSLTFDFVALNFTASAKNKYAYQLENIDRDWNDGGTHRSASYSYIPPGSYTFKVRASNNDGVWAEPVVLNVIIHPPWWETNWFRVVAAGLLIGLGVFLYKRRTNQLHRQRRVLEDMVRKRTQELEHKNELLSERQTEIIRQKEQLQVQRDDLEQQYNTIRMLSEIGQQITSSIRKDEFILQLYRILRKLITVDHFSIGHLDKEQQVIEFSTVDGDDPAIREDVLSLETETFAVMCIKTARPMSLGDISHEYTNYFSATNPRYPDQYSSAMYLPLLTMDNIITGVLVVKSTRAHAYNELNLNTLKSLAAYISIAFENVTIYRAIEAQSGLLQVQSEKLDKLDKLKTNFFINLSHEFRTPLTLILSPLENILSQNAPADWPRLQRQLVVMHKNAKQLLGLINELLEVRRLEASDNFRVTVSRNDIVGFVRMILDNYEDMIGQLGLNVHVISEVPVLEMWFDPQLMQKVFINLITNAIKYTPAFGTIEITIRRNEDAKQVVISIRDTGIGISERELPYVFDRFYQGDQPLNHIQSGSGIGLAFIRDLVRLHGGTITVASEKGRETTFTITLPEENERLVAPAAELTESPLSEAADVYPISDAEDSFVTAINQNATVLIVEDHPEVGAFLREELSHDFNVTLAVNGRDGLDQALNLIPDLVLSDVMLPLMDGMELCKVLKDDFRTSHIPVIMLTAKSGEESFIRGLNLGADDYVPKPFNVNILRARIQNLINSRKKLHYVFAAREKFRAKEVIENVRDRNFIEKLDTCIERNLNNSELNHEILGQALGMSKTQLYRKLQSITGKSVHEYIRNYRLRIACEIMKTRGDFLVFEVAYEVGFKDPAYFSKCFFAFYNFWPTDLKVGSNA